MSDLRCYTCGANLTPMDMAKINCSYCGTVLPHHARAAQQVAVVNQMMADRNGNGIPDAFEGIVSGAQGPVHLIGTGAQLPPGAYGQGGSPFQAPGAAYAAVHQQQVANMVGRTTSMVTVIVVVSLIVPLLIAGAVMWLVFARAM